MKKLKRYILLLASVVLLHACDNGFDELNTSKTGALNIDPAYQLNNVVLNLNATGFAGGGFLIYDLGIVQQIVSPNSGVLTGANYNQDNRNATQSVWQGYYRNCVRNTVDIIRKTKDDPARANMYNMARILQAYVFMVLTDEYGDIPYSAAGKGYTDQNLFPEYDSQEAIYTDIIAELTAASAALDPAGRIESADVLYGGNIDRWRRFGYSLLLRAGMRLSKVDPARAQQIVAGIPLNSLILTNADNAVVRHDGNYTNGMAVTLNGTEAANFYLTAPFVNYLKNSNDPRLVSIAVRYKGATSGASQTVDKATTNVADQVGMPMGHDNSTIGAVATGQGLASFYDFSQVDRRRMMKLTAPYFIVTAAQTNLLLAEARTRGWITTGSAATYFETGVRQSMAQMALFDAASAVPAADIENYISSHPFDPANALEQINTQYWVASFPGGPEVFANYRRTGFPVLTPNPYPGREVDFIRRLTYPVSEGSVNAANVGQAIDRMGPDALSTRVWWDKL
ncbi:MAG TPA: SusD/RagB family nutrient-binding outer membrane lipoprotein [Chryseosolibacter sp.]